MNMIMNISKKNNAEVYDFNCCCNMDRNHFEIDENPNMEIIRGIIAVPTSIAAMIENLLVLVSIWRTPALHTPSNILLVSLALTDFGVGLVTSPLFLVFNIAKLRQDEELFCSNAPGFFFTSSWFCSVSLLTLTAVSLDRLIALKTHLRYKEIVTTKRTGIITVVIWSLGLIYGALSLWDFNVAVYLSAVGIPLCFLVSTFVYCAIYKIVRRHQTQVEGQLRVQRQQEPGVSFKVYKRSFVSMFLIYFVFLFCYTPYLINSTIIVTIDVPLAFYSATEFSLSLVHLNSVLNPIIYCWRFENIRESVKETARKIFCRNPPDV